MKQVELKPYSRSVSIIGVGCTPFMCILNDPETEGLTEGELFGYAAVEAMRDAGIDASKLDFFYHGQANPGRTSLEITPAIHVADWFGARGLGCAHHSEACCTGYYALEMAVMDVASGKHDIVLSGCVDMGDSSPVPGQPAYKRTKFSMSDFNASLPMIYNRDYTQAMEAGMISGIDDPLAEYVKDYHVSPEKLDDALCAMMYNNRRAAVLNPKACIRTPMEEEAKSKGFDDPVAYLHSMYNPKMSAYMRSMGMETRTEGAAAVIVCPTEMAHQFTDHPIEVLGTGTSSLESMQVHLQRRAGEEAARQVYASTGVRPEDIDLLYINDFVIGSQLEAAVTTGYLPAETALQYFIDGRTAFDGDKPMNTNGGRTSFGHAHAASGLADVYEAVKQMRGECEARQVKKMPKTVMLRGFGGAQNVSATILRAEN